MFPTDSRNLVGLGCLKRREKKGENLEAGRRLPRALTFIGREFRKPE